MASLLANLHSHASFKAGHVSRTCFGRSPKEASHVAQLVWNAKRFPSGEITTSDLERYSGSVATEPRKCPSTDHSRRVASLSVVAATVPEELKHKPWLP